MGSYVHDQGYILSPEQELIKAQLVEKARELSAYLESFSFVERSKLWTIHGWLVGWIVIGDRRHTVHYSDRYGVVCHGICTSNGSALMIAACIPDDAKFVKYTGEHLDLVKIFNKTSESLSCLYYNELPNKEEKK